MTVFNPQTLFPRIRRMAHEIGEMFFYGDLPWHGLGRPVERPATIDEALVASGLDWEVDLVPIATAESPPSPAPHRVAVARRDREPGDPNRVLGVVHPEFRPLQNREGAEIFDRLFDPGARKYHTGGYLRNGEVVWLLARLPDDIVVERDDALETYLLYSNSHDGSAAIDIRFTTVRVVCRNTLSFALATGAAERAFRRRHRDDPDAIEADATSFFAFVRLQAEATARELRTLATLPLDDEAFRRFLWRILPDPMAPATAGTNPSTARAHASRLVNLEQTRTDIVRARSDGIPAHGVPPERPTWWGAVNAVTAWVDHLRPVSGDRYAHALFGAGDRLKSIAYLQAVAEASGRVVSIEDRRGGRAGAARA
jgi:phage/plasmid-like protein (TIGR03299 family)